MLGKIIFVAFLLGFITQKAESIEAILHGRLPSPRSGAVAIANGAGSTFVVGGVRQQGGRYRQILKFNAATGKSVEVGYFPIGQGGVAFGAGGRDVNGRMFYFYLSLIYRFSAGTPYPIQVGNLPVVVTSYAAASDGQSSIYLVGGTYYDQSNSKDIIRFDTNTNSANIVAELPFPRSGSTSAWVEDSLFVFGGINDGELCREIIRYTPSTGQVKVLDTLFPETHYVRDAVAVGQFIYTFGINRENLDLDLLIRFDTVTNTVEQRSITGLGKLFAAAVAISPQNDQIYTLGGVLDSNEGVIDDIYRIDLF